MFCYDSTIPELFKQDDQFALESIVFLRLILRIVNSEFQLKIKTLKFIIQKENTLKTRVD